MNARQVAVVLRSGPAADSWFATLSSRFAIMPHRLSHRRSLLALTRGLCVLVLLVGGAQACNVPVFRYALERWRADDYRITIVHHGSLTPEGEQLAANLLAHQTQRTANVAVERVDVGQLSEDDRRVPDDRAWLTDLDRQRLPLVTLQYHAGYEHQTPLAMGKLSGPGIAQLLDSPARRELIRRLTSGHTAVWLLVPSSDAAQNMAVEERLTSVSRQLATSLKLPVLTDAAADTLLSDVPLRIEFSTLTVPRDSASEQGLLTMLLHSEPALTTLDEPLVFPVFGRGRSLLALAGDGINESNLRAAAELLCGACSCEVKDLHPGFDLLLTQRWESLLTQPAANAPSGATASAPGTGPELVAIPPGATTAPAESVPSNVFNEASRRNFVLWTIALTALAGLACGGWYAIYNR